VDTPSPQLRNGQNEVHFRADLNIRSAGLVRGVRKSDFGKGQQLKRDYSKGSENGAKGG